MKKSLRIALAAALLAFVAPIPSYASPSGGDPRPQVAGVSYASPSGGDPRPQVAGVSSISVVVSVILSVLGL